MTRGSILAALAALGLVVMAASVAAMEPKALPTFSVTALDGQAASSAQIAPPDGRWLFVYVRPESRLSAAVLGVLKKGESSPVDRMVVVVAGDVDAARKLAEGCPNLAAARWYADADGEAFTRLGLAGTPVVLGARADRLEWKLDGTLAERQLKSVLASWLASASAPAPAP